MLKITQSRQVSYVDIRRRDSEFHVDDKVYLKISPMNGVMRFGKKENLSPLYVGPYQILRWIVKVTYEPYLLNDLASVYPVFHINLLKKCVGHSTFIVPLEGLELRRIFLWESSGWEFWPASLKMKDKEIAFVKVLWGNKLVEGATWEAKDDMMSRYPQFFHIVPNLAWGI